MAYKVKCSVTVNFELERKEHFKKQDVNNENGCSFSNVTIRLRTGSGDKSAVFGGNRAHAVRLTAVC